MKKFFISFVLIISLLFNVFADNKQAHKELREVFENYGLLPELIEKGFSLDKLDKIDDPIEMKDYLQPFFMDENGMPLDNHASISFYSPINNEFFSYNKFLGKVNTRSQMFIEWSDEYGSKNELLKKGYKEDEIFYYPYFNGEWKDGYRVGKKFMEKAIGKPLFLFKDYFSESKNTLLFGLKNFSGEPNFYDELEVISNSKKKYLILDFSNNPGGLQANYDELVKAIKKMSPKEIFIMIDYMTISMGEYSTLHFEKDCGIKTTFVGYPTGGGYAACRGDFIVNFDNFEIDGSLGRKAGYYGPEGVGIAPKYYTNNSIESLEVIKHLIKDDELSLPKDYIENINRTIKYKKWN